MVGNFNDALDTIIVQNEEIRARGVGLLDILSLDEGAILELQRSFGKQLGDKFGRDLQLLYLIH